MCIDSVRCVTVAERFVVDFVFCFCLLAQTAVFVTFTRNLSLLLASKHSGCLSIDDIQSFNRDIGHTVACVSGSAVLQAFLGVSPKDPLYFGSDLDLFASHVCHNMDTCMCGVVL